MLVMGVEADVALVVIYAEQMGLEMSSWSIWSSYRN
jgi:hypothetical protein